MASLIIALDVDFSLFLATSQHEPTNVLQRQLPDFKAKYAIARKSKPSHRIDLKDVGVSSGRVQIQVPCIFFIRFSELFFTFVLNERNSEWNVVRDKIENSAYGKCIGIRKKKPDGYLARLSEDVLIEN